MSTTLEASYDTAAEAIAAGMIGKGWIPEWIPRNAVDLREVHDLDTNVSALAFEVPDARRIQLPEDCKPIGAGDTVPSHFTRRWWPSEGALRAYAFFECDSDATDHLFVGIRSDGKHVLQWRTYGR